MKKQFKFYSAVFTLFCFLTSSFAPVSYAAAPSIQTIQNFQTNSNDAATQSFRLDLPSELGTVESLQSGTGPAVVHIQTAHGNYEAQKKIQGILEFLNKNYGFKHILVEGSSFKFHNEFLQFFPEDMDATREVADRLTKEALIKGPELFLIDHPEAQAEGIENLETYKANGRAFFDVLTQQEKTGKFLSGMDMQIDSLAGAYLNKELRSFLTRLDNFEAKRVPFMDWFSFLKEKANQTLNIQLNDAAYQLDWPMMVRLYTLTEIEKKLNPSALEAEKKTFLKAVSFLPQATLEKVTDLLNTKVSRNQLSDPDTRILFEQMVSALPADFTYDSFPNVKLYIGHLILQSEIRSALLMAEENKLSAKISGRLAKTEEEKKLISLLEDYRLLKKLFALELTPENYEKLLARGKDILPSKIAQRFSEVNGKKLVKNVKFEHLNDIDQLFEKALEFYRLVKKRDDEMTINVAEKIREMKTDKVAVITGGFHSGPFQDFFSKNGFSYALISPKITTLEGDTGHSAYVKTVVASMSSSYASQTWESPFPYAQNSVENVEVFGGRPVYAADRLAELLPSGKSVESSAWHQANFGALAQASELRAVDPAIVKPRFDDAAEVLDEHITRSPFVPEFVTGTAARTVAVTVEEDNNLDPKDYQIGDWRNGYTQATVKVKDFSKMPKHLWEAAVAEVAIQGTLLREVKLSGDELLSEAERVRAEWTKVEVEFLRDNTEGYLERVVLPGASANDTSAAELLDRVQKAGSIKEPEFQWIEKTPVDKKAAGRRIENGNRVIYDVVAGDATRLWESLVKSGAVSPEEAASTDVKNRFRMWNLDVWDALDRLKKRESFIIEKARQLPGIITAREQALGGDALGLYQKLLELELQITREKGQEQVRLLAEKDRLVALQNKFRKEDKQYGQALDELDLFGPLATDLPRLTVPENAQRIGLGAYRLAALAISIREQAGEYEYDAKTALANYKLVVVVNRQILADVKRDLIENKFFGFSPENIVLVNSDSWPPYARTSEGFKIYSKATVPYNHGKALISAAREWMSYIYDAELNDFRLVKDTAFDYLRRESLGDKKAESILVRRINDIKLLHTKQASAQNLFAVYLALKEKYGAKAALVGMKRFFPEKGGIIIQNPVLGGPFAASVEELQLKDKAGVLAKQVASAREAVRTREDRPEGTLLDLFYNRLLVEGDIEALLEVIGDQTKLPGIVKEKPGADIFSPEIPSTNILTEEEMKAVLVAYQQDALIDDGILDPNPNYNPDDPQGDITADFKSSKDLLKLVKALAFLNGQIVSADQQVQVTRSSDAFFGELLAPAVAEVKSENSYDALAALYRSVQEDKGRVRKIENALTTDEFAKVKEAAARASELRFAGSSAGVLPRITADNQLTLGAPNQANIAAQLSVQPGEILDPNSNSIPGNPQGNFRSSADLLALAQAITAINNQVASPGQIDQVVRSSDAFFGEKLTPAVAKAKSGESYVELALLYRSVQADEGRRGKIESVLTNGELTKLKEVAASADVLPRITADNQLTLGAPNQANIAAQLSVQPAIPSQLGTPGQSIQVQFLTPRQIELATQAVSAVRQPDGTSRIIANGSSGIVADLFTFGIFSFNAITAAISNFGTAAVQIFLTALLGRNAYAETIDSEAGISVDEVVAPSVKVDFTLDLPGVLDALPADYDVTAKDGKVAISTAFLIKFAQENPNAFVKLIQLYKQLQPEGQPGILATVLPENMTPQQFGKEIQRLVRQQGSGLITDEAFDTFNADFNAVLQILPVVPGKNVAETLKDFADKNQGLIYIGPEAFDALDNAMQLVLGKDLNLKDSREALTVAAVIAHMKPAADLFVAIQDRGRRAETLKQYLAQQLALKLEGLRASLGHKNIGQTLSLLLSGLKRLETSV